MLVDRARLRHRIAIQEPVKTQSATTGEMIITSWQTLVISGLALSSVPAEVLTGPGKEFIASAAKQLETTARINIRWFPASLMELAQCRILWDGRIYDVVSIETDKTARQEWRFKCIDGVSNGQ